MVTTSRLVLLDTVGRDGNDLIHLTGPVQVVARAAMGTPDGTPFEVELRFDAARVRGVGLKTGASYWAEGLHQSRLQPKERSTAFDVWGHFELLGAAPNDTQRTRRTLSVRFRVTVPADGRVTIAAEEVTLRPGSHGSVAA